MIEGAWILALDGLEALCGKSLNAFRLQGCKAAILNLYARLVLLDLCHFAPFFAGFPVSSGAEIGPCKDVVGVRQIWKQSHIVFRLFNHAIILARQTRCQYLNHIYLRPHGIVLPRKIRFLHPFFEVSSGR